MLSSSDSGCKDIIDCLEDCIDLVDKLISICSRVRVGETLSPGTLFQMYTVLVDLRERVVEARMSIYRYCRGNESSCSNY